MSDFLKIPKVQLAITLTLIYLTTLKQFAISSSLLLLIIALGFTIFFDLAFTYFRKRVFFMPWAALVTGLIIALIIDPSALWYQIAIISALAMASKNFLRIGGKHIFNPAGAGLFLGGMIFNLPVSWWAASFQVLDPINLSHILIFLIILFPGIVSFYRMRRFGSILSFLIVYNLLSGFRILFDPTTIFFALVMLPEPMTSPFNMTKQIIYGVLVAVVSLILSHLSINLPDILIPALLLGNLLFSQLFFQ